MNGCRYELIFGGASSGKSAFAEEEAMKSGRRRVYLATMRHGSVEGDRKISAHRRRREGKGFETIECPVRIASVSDMMGGSTVLLECLSNLAANEMFGEGYGTSGRSGPVELLCDRIIGDITVLGRAAEEVIVVSGDIMRDGICYGKETESYIRLLAMLNRRMLDMSDRGFEVIYGCPKRIK